MEPEKKQINKENQRKDSNIKHGILCNSNQNKGRVKVQIRGGGKEVVKFKKTVR